MAETREAYKKTGSQKEEMRSKEKPSRRKVMRGCLGMFTQQDPGSH